MWSENNHSIVRFFFFFFTLHPNAGWLWSTVGDTVLSLCPWQRSLCSLSAASCIGKFHPLTLGLYVTITEAIDRAHLICCKRRGSQREWERQSVPSIKRRLNMVSEPKSQQVMNPQGVMKIFPSFVSSGAK